MYGSESSDAQSITKPRRYGHGMISAWKGREDIQVFEGTTLGCRRRGDPFDR